MDKKPLSIKSQIHTMIDTIFSLDVNNSLPELISKHIALQNYILSLRLVEAEVNDYLSDHNVKEYMTKYQLYCLDFEICLENLMSEALMNFNCSSEIIRLLRNYYSSIYEFMSKNEILLSNCNKDSKICMVGVGSMPLSMLFMQRFSGAQMFGIDKFDKTISI